MVGGENFRESQFNLAVQGERQPGSSFKPFVLATALTQGISPSTTLRLEAGDDLRRRPALGRPQLRGRVPRLDRPDARRRSYSDNTVFAQLTRSSGRSERRDDGAQARHHDAAQRRTSRSASAPSRSTRSRWRARSRRSQRRPAHRRLALRQPAARDRARRSNGDATTNAPVPRPVLTPDQRGDRRPSILQGVVRYGTGKRGGAPDRAGRRQDRHDRELRRRLVRRLHAAARRRRLGRLPERAAADADRVPRRCRSPAAPIPARSGRLHGAGARRYLKRPPRAFPAPTRRYAAEAAVVCATALELDNGFCRDTISRRVLLRRGPRKTANCKPNEVEIPNVVGDDARARRRGSPRSR